VNDDKSALASHDEPTGAPPSPDEAKDDEERGGISGVAASIAGAAGPVAASIAGAGGNVISGARRLISGGRDGARIRAVRRMGHEPLVNLWAEHPEARRASIRELGFRGVPVNQIAGTAVEGEGQRGGDFLPLKERRSDDWRSRWQHILLGVDELAALPPIELIKFGDRYWVVDGHNRVAAALYTGQEEIDSVVQELRLPGMPAEPPVLIAPLLEGSLDLRDAGAGRYTRTGSRPVGRLPMQLRDDDTEREK
jgi:hypothetical protein